MKSIYEKIKTPKELIDEVKVHGLNTESVNIARAQDIFGRANYLDLADLANEEPQNFYMVLFTIWNWEDATNFYNENSNRKYINAMEAEKELEKIRQEVKSAGETLAESEERYKAEQKDRIKAEEASALATVRIVELEKKITELKAKLYDVLIGDKETK